MGEFTPSVYQQNVFSWIQNPTHQSLIIQAVAGSGKSTTLVKGVEMIPEFDSVVLLAFNVRIVEAIRPKLPKRVQAATLNSVGFRAWLKCVPIGLKVDGKKMLNIKDEVFPEGILTADIQKTLIANYEKVVKDSKMVAKYIKSLHKSKMYKEVEDLNRLVALAKTNGLVPSSISRKMGCHVMLEDTIRNWEAIIDTFDLDISRADVAIELGRRMLEKSIKAADKVIDYDDQLYMPVICGAPFQTYDWVLVDESQDLSPIQRQMIKSMAGDRGRIIFCGDKRQSIYSWRGAEIDSMGVIRDEFNSHELPLSICYRCGKDIVKRAQLYVDHIEYHPDKHVGEVRDLEKYGPSEFGPNDVILCRNSRPLVELAFKLIRNKVPVRIAGKDIEHSLVSLAEKMGCDDLDELMHRLDKHVEKETARYTDRGMLKKVEAVQNRVDTLKSFISNLSKREYNLSGLVECINRVFRMEDLKKKQMLVLSTIHKAKGQEWDNVFILDFHLIPSKYAVQEWQLQEEQNLQYVAVTRAIHTLTFIDSKGFVDPMEPNTYSEVDKTDELCYSELTEGTGNRYH